ncbi:MAG: ABC transporter ATP-binding protein [Clostridiales Family XIII bacterium]|nr:ABC transporter ATP-binding protein [Clostridiales Family XIII bacterium]
MTHILLQTRGLTKKYGDFTALNNVSLTLQQGDIYGLVGRNGAGKTTFFKCVMGLAKFASGEIKMGGRNDSLSAARRRIGFMINPSFFPYLNPAQSLEYLCRVRGVHSKGEVERVLKIVGLYGIKKPFKAFSTGMKQRLGIAGALLNSPPIVVLDEPINGLDPQGIADIREVVRTTAREYGTTFIISSHILSELDLVATTFGFIDHGRLLREITHADLHEHTRKSLIVDVDDGARAYSVLASRLGITDTEVAGNRLTLRSGIGQSNVITRELVAAGLEVYRVAPQETTLEEYFMGLVGGGNE